MRLGLLLALLLGSVTWATVTWAPAQAEITPEAAARHRKALSGAVAEKKPGARVKAIERFLKRQGLPENLAGAARRELVRALVKHDPKRAPERTGPLARNLERQQQAELYQILASSLLETNQHPEPALEAARRAAAIPDAKPRRLYRETLGLALKANGREAEARVELEAALRENASAFRAANMLAEMAEAEGRGEEAVALRAHAFLARPVNEAWERLKAAYGGRAGLEEYLDERYKTLFPAPVHPEAFQPGAQRTERTVLAELYTGAGCPPCAAADLAFDAALERYSRRDVAVVMYHVHIPRPDPMTNAGTKERWEWQKGQGVPAYAVDGEAVTGGGTREHAEERFGQLRELLDAALEKAPGARLVISARHNGGALAVRAEVGDLPSESKNLRLHVVLVEKQLRYSGENGIRFHPMVARQIAKLKLSGEGLVEHRFELAEVEAALRAHLDEFEKYDKRHNPEGEFRFRARMDRMDWENLAVVAYIQDTESREVLQAAFAEASMAERTAR